MDRERRLASAIALTRSPSSFKNVDPAKPFNPIPAPPAGHNCTQRCAVQVLERLTTHMASQENLLGFDNGQAEGISCDRFQAHPDCSSSYAGGFQEVVQVDTSPHLGCVPTKRAVQGSVKLSGGQNQQLVVCPHRWPFHVSHNHQAPDGQIGLCCVCGQGMRDREAVSGVETLQAGAGEASWRLRYGTACG